MLPKAHLTSHSMLFGFRWMITPLWLSGTWRSLLYNSVYSCHLFLISSASVRSISFLSFIQLIFAWNIPLVSPIFLNRSLNSVQVSHSVMSNSLWPHGLQHIRLPCPSPTPGVYSNSYPSSRWCHPTILSSVVPFPPAFNLSQYQGLFQWVSSLHQVAKVLEFQVQHQSFQWTARTDFLKNWLVWSPCSPRDSQESSPTPQFKSINSSALSLLYSPTLTSIHKYWKTIALTRWTFVGKVMSLLFKMLSVLVIVFLPRSKHLLISYLQSPPAVILEPPKSNVCHCFPL